MNARKSSVLVIALAAALMWASVAAIVAWLFGGTAVQVCIAAGFAFVVAGGAATLALSLCATSQDERDEVDKYNNFGLGGRI